MSTDPVVTSPVRPLPVNDDAQVEISHGETGWETFCHEPFCQREESYMTHRQARSWRTSHRAMHANGEAVASRTYWPAYDMAHEAVAAGAHDTVADAVDAITYREGVR